MLSCQSGHTFTEHELSMPHDHDNYDHTSGRCPVCDGEPFEIEDGATVYIDGRGILHDADPVNVLLQKEDRVSVDIAKAAARVVGVGALMFVLTIVSLAVILPDHMEGRVSDDAPATWRAE